MMKIIKHIDRLLPICARKPNLIRRTLRPKCGAGTPTFLSTVYNRGTQAKKRQADVPQCGRSMIEMLGVLAIIGMLTVGSITGYSKAMQRHYLNRQAEQISYIMNVIETHIDMFDLSMNSNTPALIPVFKTFDWLPQEMVKDNSNHIYDIFNNRIGIGITKGQYLSMTINIVKKNAYEQCINIYSVAKHFHSSLWHNEVYNDEHYTPGRFGDRYCNKTQRCIKDMTPAEMSNLCKVCKDKDQCIFHFFWLSPYHPNF